MKKSLSELKPWRKTLVSVALTVISIAAFVLSLIMLVDSNVPSSKGYAALVAIFIAMILAIVTVPIVIILCFVYPAKWAILWSCVLAVLATGFWVFIWAYNNLR